MSFYDFFNCKITIHRYNISGIFSNAKIIQNFMEKNLKITAVTGPTATGKTALAVKLAEFFGGEIISLDSRQLYKYMDIGSGKDISEYKNVPYHLIDIAHPNDIVDLAQVLGGIQRAIDEIASKNKPVFLCGGTALYLESLLKRRTLTLEESDPELRQKLNELDLEELTNLIRSEFPASYEELNADDRRNPLRIRRKIENAVHSSDNAVPVLPPWRDFDILTIGVYFPRTIVRENIRRRLDARFDEGMIDEIRYIHDEQHVPWEKLEKFGLEYREISRFLQKKCTESEMRTELLNKIRQFAKRQDIFFRKIERENFPIHWLDGRENIFENAKSLVNKHLSNETLPSPSFRLSDIKN